MPSACSALPIFRVPGALVPCYRALFALSSHVAYADAYCGIDFRQHPEHYRRRQRRARRWAASWLWRAKGGVELIGNFNNGGREWQPQGEPERVDIHDFPSDALGKAIPYGVYDIAANDGFRSSRSQD